jgi:hypothetical protein
MKTQVTRGRGNLYREADEQLISAISYQIQEEFASEVSRWWGEFTFTDNVNFGDSAHCIIKLEDGRQGRCHARKLVNRVVRGAPPRFVYHFTGTSRLE